MKFLIRYLRILPRSVWLYWGFLLVLLYGFAVLAEDVIERDGIAFDGLFLGMLQNWRTESLDAAAISLDVVGSSYFLIPVLHKRGVRYVRAVGH